MPDGPTLNALARHLDIMAAIGLLKSIHGSYVQKKLTKSKVHELFDSNRNPDRWKQAAHIAEIGGDWIPEYLDFQHDVTVGEAWDAFRLLVVEMAKNGDLRP